MIYAQIIYIMLIENRSTLGWLQQVCTEFPRFALMCSVFFEISFIHRPAYNGAWLVPSLLFGGYCLGLCQESPQVFKCPIWIPVEILIVLRKIACFWLNHQSVSRIPLYPRESCPFVRLIGETEGMLLMIPEKVRLNSVRFRISCPSAMQFSWYARKSSFVAVSASSSRIQQLWIKSVIKTTDFFWKIGYNEH